MGLENKPAGVPCKWLVAGGCRIYPQRFELCHHFRCAWLADQTWEQAWRPDLVGLLCLRERLDEETPAALVYELRDGALGNPESAKILADLCRTAISVTVVARDGTRKRLPGTWRPDNQKRFKSLSEVYDKLTI